MGISIFPTRHRPLRAITGRPILRSLAPTFAFRSTNWAGVISPLLSNIYLHVLDTLWTRHGAPLGQLVRYADDFVVMCKTKRACEQSEARIRVILARLGLELHRDKTRRVELYDGKQGFEFLGYTMGPKFAPEGGEKYLGAGPSRKSVQRIKDKIGDLLKPVEKGSWPGVRARLNRLLAGWSGYFSYGTRVPAYRAVDHHVSESVRRFLAKRHKEPGRGTGLFSWEEIHGKLGVTQLIKDRGAAAVGLP